MKRTPPNRVGIEIHVGGHAYPGVYWTVGAGPSGMLTVSSSEGRRIARLGQHADNVEALAKVLLTEIVTAALRRQQ